MRKKGKGKGKGKGRGLGRGRGRGRGRRGGEDSMFFPKGRGRLDFLP